MHDGAHGIYASTRRESTGHESIKVWDLPVRLFHWSLVAFIAIAWITGEEEGVLFAVHKIAGYGVIALVLFRIGWGIVGSRYARFGAFVRPWSEVRTHLQEIAKLNPSPSLGHNPAGGWMIILLLATLGALTTAGLFAGGREIAGPLASTLPSVLSHAIGELHGVLANALLLLIAIHVLGVIVETWLTGDHLTEAMITGRKNAAHFFGQGDSAMAPLWLAAVILAFASGLTWVIVTL